MSNNYGFCPVCWCDNEGATRERRADEYTICRNGHKRKSTEWVIPEQMKASRIQEVDCDQCHGTGKVKYCPLCHNTGFVAKIEHSGTSECGSSYYGTTPCPNGCTQFNGCQQFTICV